MDESEGRGKRKTVNLDVDTFLARVLEHVPPPGFQAVRPYGLFANPCQDQLAVARAHFGQASLPKRRRRMPVAGGLPSAGPRRRDRLPHVRRTAGTFGPDPRPAAARRRRLRLRCPLPFPTRNPNARRPEAPPRSRSFSPALTAARFPSAPGPKKWAAPRPHVSSETIWRVWHPRSAALLLVGRTSFLSSAAADRRDIPPAEPVREAAAQTNFLGGRPSYRRPPASSTRSCSGRAAPLSHPAEPKMVDFRPAHALS